MLVWPTRIPLITATTISRCLIATVFSLTLMMGFGCHDELSIATAAARKYPSSGWYADLYSSPFVVRSSPNGRGLLIYDQTSPTAQVLRVVNADTLETEHILALNKTCLRFMWNPDGHRLSFFCFAGPTRELYLWDMDTGSLNRLNALQTRAEGWLSWSPDGRYLAYKSQISAASEPTQYVLMDSRTLSVVPLALPSSALISWAPDSQRFALIDKARPHSVDIVDMSGRLIRRVELDADIKIKSITWAARTERLLVLFSHLAQSSYDMGILTLPGETLKNVATLPDEPEALTWSPDEANIFFTRDLADGRSVFQLSLNSRTIKPIIVGGFNSIVAATSDSAALIFKHDETEPESWYRYQIREKREELLYRPKLSTLPDIPGHVVSYPTLDHVNAQIVEHRSPKPLSPPAAIISLHGGDLTTRAHVFWDSTAQISLREGVHWLEVNYRGAIGSPYHDPPTFTTASTDVDAAIEYAHSVLQVPYSRIAVRGNSEGAMVAVETARRFPNHIGVLFLSGLVHTDDSMFNFPYSGAPHRVILVHLKYDQNSLVQSRRLLETALTPSVTHESEYHEYEIEDEHSEIVPTTRAAMYEILLNMVKY